MVKCIKCGAPLSGFLSYISRILGVRPSAENPNICNKCISRQTPAERENLSAPQAKKKSAVNGQEFPLSSRTAGHQTASVNQPPESKASGNYPGPGSGQQAEVDQQEAQSEIEKELN